MKYKIAVLPGDGIGPEVLKQGIKILEAISNSSELQFDYEFLKIGGVAIEAKGEPVTTETIKRCRAADAVLFGAIGDPKYDNNPDSAIRPEQGLLRLRKELKLFANIRPVVTYPELYDQSPLKIDRLDGVDFVIYRELTSGIYFGKKGREEEGKIAYDVCEYKENEILRITRLAFEAARGRGKKLTLVDKANVMESSRLWRRTVREFSKGYEDVELEMLFVDNAAMQLILNPKQFDVILTSNMFGDILSDEASVITGSLGLLPSASVGKSSALFEPIHGSYPQAKGFDIANPIGTILSVAMMLDHLGHQKFGDLVREAVEESFKLGIVAKDLDVNNYYSTEEIGDQLTSLVSKKMTRADLSRV